MGLGFLGKIYSNKMLMFENNLFFREDESSIYTVIIYLNSDFEGGGTNFLHEGGDQVVLIPSSPYSVILPPFVRTGKWHAALNPRLVWLLFSITMFFMKAKR